MANLLSPTELLKQPNITTPIGQITTDQLKGLTAQYAKDINQPANVISMDKGLGKFGFSADALEQQGVLTPGIAASITPATMTDILADPTVWTGKYGINDVHGLLHSESIQHDIQQDIFASTHASLLESGLVTGTESAESLSGMISGAVKVGTHGLESLLNGNASATVINIFTSAADSANQVVAMVSATLAAGAVAVSDSFSSVADSVLSSDVLASLGTQAKSTISSLVPGIVAKSGDMATTVSALNNSVQFASAVSAANTLPTVPEMKAMASAVDFGSIGAKMAETVNSTRIYDSFIAQAGVALPEPVIISPPTRVLSQLPNININKGILV